MRNKSESVIIRYTKEQKEFHQQKADKAKTSLSEFLRQAGDNAEIIIKDESVILNTLEAINRIGNNINQMAKSANTANLSGKVSDDMLREHCFRLKLCTDELKTLYTIIKMKAD